MPGLGLALESCAPEPVAPPCIPASEIDVLVRRGDYYRCLDGTLERGEGCGAEGYPLGYGAKYADRYFEDAYPALTSAGQGFFRRVSSCLQVRMAAWVTPEAACDAVWDHGFDTHAGCWIDAGFCALPPEDVLEIVDVLDPEDRDMPEVRSLLLEVAQACPAR